eukprot:gene10817-18978_t
MAQPVGWDNRSGNLDISGVSDEDLLDMLGDDSTQGYDVIDAGPIEAIDDDIRSGWWNTMEFSSDANGIANSPQMQRKQQRAAHAAAADYSAQQHFAEYQTSNSAPPSSFSAKSSPRGAPRGVRQQYPAEAYYSMQQQQQQLSQQHRLSRSPRGGRRSLGVGMSAIASAVRTHTSISSASTVGSTSSHTSYKQATQAMKAAAAAAAAVAAASPRANGGGQAMMMAAAADLMSKGHSNGLGAAVRAFGGRPVSRFHEAGVPGLVPIPDMRMSAESGPLYSQAATVAAAAHAQAATHIANAAVHYRPRHAEQHGAAAGAAAMTHARHGSSTGAGGSKAKAKAKATRGAGRKGGGQHSSNSSNVSRARSTSPGASNPSDKGQLRGPSYNGASTYTAVTDPVQPGGPHRRIKANGEWSKWVLECGAKERNAAIREFGLTVEEVADLKKTSRRMKLLFAQRRYLAGLRQREAEKAESGS